MAPVEPSLLDISDRFIHVLERETGYRAIVCDESGRIVRASVRERVGDLHAGAQRIVRNEVDEAAITAEEEAANPLVREGHNCPIIVTGRRVGTFGITGPLEIARPIARIAALTLGSWLEDDQRCAVTDQLRSSGPRRPRVLYVDDSPAALSHLKELLQAEHDVEVAESGARGLEAARSDPPDVVLCDYDMPGMNGLQFLLAIKADPVLQSVPVVIFTGGASRESAARMLAAGAHDFLLKSAGEDEVRARVAAAVRSHRAHQQASAERQTLSRMAALFARSEGRARAVIESALDAIVLVDTDDRIETMNDAAERMFGCSQAEAAGRNFFRDFVARASRDALTNAHLQRTDSKARSGPLAYEVHCVRSGGEIFPAEVRCRQLGTGAGSGWCVFVRDLTDARRLAMDLHQAQKLEAVGRLASGIAHEINTPIQFIGDNTHFLREAVETLLGLIDAYAQAVRPDSAERLHAVAAEADLPYLRSTLPDAITRTLAGVERVATIVRAMKEFAHPDQKEMKATDINRSIEATLQVARNEYKYVADVETDLGPLPYVECHPGEINQVVLNLVVNAAHAISDVVQGTQGRGKIRVKTLLVDGQVAIAISDTGTGIPEDVRGKIFEPFYTTKEVGRGTGQGLALARAIVKKHGGSITFSTEVGKGTTFDIRLPTSRPNAADGA